MHGVAALFVDGDARMEAHLRIRRALAAGTRRPHRPRDGRDAGARGRPAGAAAPRARDRRVGGPLHRPLRHGVGHHVVVPGDRRLEQHQPRRSSRRASRRRCLRPRSACSPPSPPSSSTTSSPRRCRGSRRAWKASPTSSRRSCRGRSTNGTWPDGRRPRIRRSERPPPQGAPPSSADVGDQRHAVRRRDARASDRLHGGGAAPDRRHSGRPAARRRRAARQRGGAALRHDRRRRQDHAAGSGGRRSTTCSRRLQAIVQIDPEKRIILRANRNADYGTVAQVLDRIKKAGSRHVALETRRSRSRTAEPCGSGSPSRSSATQSFSGWASSRFRRRGRFRIGEDRRAAGRSRLGRRDTDLLKGDKTSKSAGGEAAAEAGGEGRGAGAGAGREAGREGGRSAAPPPPPPPPEPQPVAPPEPEQQVAALPEPAPEAGTPSRSVPSRAGAGQSEHPAPAAQSAEAVAKPKPEPSRKVAQQPETPQPEFNADDIAALLNKQEPRGGGDPKPATEPQTHRLDRGP